MAVTKYRWKISSGFGSSDTNEVLRANSSVIGRSEVLASNSIQPCFSFLL